MTATILVVDDVYSERAVIGIASWVSSYSINSSSTNREYMRRCNRRSGNIISNGVRAVVSSQIGRGACRVREFGYV